MNEPSDDVATPEARRPRGRALLAGAVLGVSLILNVMLLTAVATAPSGPKPAKGTPHAAAAVCPPPCETWTPALTDQVFRYLHDRGHDEDQAVCLTKWLTALNRPNELFEGTALDKAEAALRARDDCLHSDSVAVNAPDLTDLRRSG